ncbi:MAG: hypothetical protein WBD99_14730 [Thermodesulfobacteriota bacterium]
MKTAYMYQFACLAPSFDLPEDSPIKLVPEWIYWVDFEDSIPKPITLSSEP